MFHACTVPALREDFYKREEKRKTLSTQKFEKREKMERRAKARGGARVGEFLRVGPAEAHERVWGGPPRLVLEPAPNSQVSIRSLLVYLRYVFFSPIRTIESSQHRLAQVYGRLSITRSIVPPSPDTSLTHSQTPHVELR